MDKQIFVINGSGGVGKDTFVELFARNNPVGIKNYSSIERLKTFALSLGYKGSKTEKDRKFLSELKKLCNEYNDFSINNIRDTVTAFKDDPAFGFLFIHIREPEEIARVVQEFDAKTILIKSNRVAPITSNDSDKRVADYLYDYIFSNNDSLEDFEEEIKSFRGSILANFIKKTIRVQCTSNEEMLKVEKLIHNQLIGNEDYINSRICLNNSLNRKDNTEYRVNIVFFADCETEPQLLIP